MAGKRRSKGKYTELMISLVDRVEAIDAACKTEIGSIKESYQNDVRDIKNMVGKIFEIINGNGKPGLKDRISRIEGGLKLATVLLGSGGIIAIVVAYLSMHKGG